MKLSEFKANNPEYKDRPDREVAEEIYSKHYAKKMTKEQFFKQVGVEEKKDGKLEELESFIETATERNKALKAENATANDRLKDLSAENKKLELEGAASAREVTRLEKQVMELRADLKARDVDLSYSRKESSDNLGAHRQEVAALQSTIKRMETEKPKGDPKVAELKATVSKLQSEVRKLEGELTLRDMKIMQLDKPQVPAVLKQSHKPWAGTVTVERTFNNGMAQVLRFEPEE